MGSLYNRDSNQLLGCGELLPLEMAQHIRHLCGPDRNATGAVRDSCRSGAPAVGREGHECGDHFQMGSFCCFPLVSLSYTLLEAGTVG